MMSMGNRIFVALLICSLLASCKPKSLDSTSAEKNKACEKPLSQKGLSESRHLLQNGDIILRTGNDVISGIFAQLNKRDKTYSHCGIAFIENGHWMVYHSIGGEDNPDEKLRRDPFEKFVGSDHNLGFAICRYPLTENQSQKLQKTVTLFYDNHTPFDMKFDLKTDDHLYCAEMVYKAFNIALNTSHFFATTTHKGFEYVSTDNIFGNNIARILCHIVY